MRPLILRRSLQRCLQHSHYAIFTALAAALTLAMPTQAQQKTEREGVEVGKASSFRKLVPAEGLEQGATRQYAQLLQQAQQQRALAPDTHPQVVRLRAIAAKIVPFTAPWNERAKLWKWEVNLIGSKQVNAFCMPGGKIAFYTGIIDTLKLSDDEIAAIMGHEVAHALREHARERIGKSTATNYGLRIGAAVLGLGQLGDIGAQYGAQLLTLKFGRDDESEADLVGLDLAARAGFDPRAGVALWQKMGSLNKGAPPQWLSTHPAGTTRIKDIEKHLKEVMPLYAKAKGTTVAMLPAYQSNIAELQRGAPSGTGAPPQPANASR
jgi:predicted Zn-dependent protease